MTSNLPNRMLVTLVMITLGALVVYFAFVMNRLPEPWRTPGSSPLYLAGVLGTMLLLVSLGFVFVKRTGRGGSPRLWFIAHVIASLLGAILVAVHCAGHLRRPPALLYLALLALAFLGVWARVYLNRRMAATFGTKLRAFAVASDEAHPRLAEIIHGKRKILRTLDPLAAEATFSVTLAHWLKAPRLAFAYARLVREESREIGARRSVGPAQAYWRPLHLALAGLFVAGVVIHVVTVTFFAGYVADGGPITWWHLAAW